VNKRGQMINSKNRKGISSIIATLILLLLTIVLVGIVWAVVSGIVKTSTEGVSSGAQCLNSAIDITAASCTGAGVCNVTVQRTLGSDVIGGVRVIFFNEAKDSTNFTDIGGDIQVSGMGRLTNTPINVVNVNEINAYIYFTQTSGTKTVCSVPAEYKNVQLI